MANKLYVELALGNIYNRKHIVPVSNLRLAMENAVRTKSPLFKSYYLFDEEIKEHFKVYQTVRSFRGKFYLNNLIFDIDRKTDTPEFTLERMKMFIDKLIDEWKADEEEMQIWFSGRGYHIVIPDMFGFKPSNQLPQEVSKTLNKYFPESDNIYDGSRLIRVGYTFNDKDDSKKFKIPIKYEELNTITSKEILDLAESPRLDVVLPKIRDKASAKNYDLIVRSEETKDIKLDEPTKIVTCMQKLYQMGATEGSRHLSIMRMTSAFRRAGIPQMGIKLMMRQWAPTLTAYEVDRQVDDVFTKAYRYGCNDPIMKEYCDPKCVFFRNKDYTQNVYEASELEKNYVKFVRTGIPDNSFNMQNMFQLPNPFWVYPKEFMVITGDTGLGKTSLHQNMLIQLGMNALVLNFEISNELLFRRNIQIKYGMTKQQVMDHYMINDNSLSQGVSFIKVMSVSPEIEAIAKLVAEVNPKILVIDTIEDIISHSKGANEKMDEIAKALKAIAISQNIIVIGINHISKHGALDEKGKRKEMTVHSGKGASTIEQKADKVITIEGEPTQSFRIIRSLKARDEHPFRQAFKFTADTFRFIPMDISDPLLEV
ncbi:MAG: AAA family ATPase [Bacteroidota bacterium]|nr:AAA family ATPase [Bacteroidota bacterium]